MKSIWGMGISGVFVLGMGGCGPILDVDADEYQPIVAKAPVCQAGELECEGNAPRTCVNGLWQELSVCVGQTCVDGSCRGECEAGQAGCVGNTPRICDANGKWVSEAACSGAMGICLEGACRKTPPSCVGLPATCGPKGDESCCAMTHVPGGTYNRSNEPMFPATVSDFVLDRFEITVGRFRKFVEAYPGSKPVVGAGTHPLIAGSGWDAAWDAELPADQAGLMMAIKCHAEVQTWTDSAGAHENLPLNCLSWIEALAFCAWDSGRLVTEAEWNYAAAGGGEQRQYPWSNPPGSTVIDGSYAVYDGLGDGSVGGVIGFGDILQVGSKSPKGDGRWGQADLGGSMWEWALDWYNDPYVAACEDCAAIGSGSSRVIRGGYFADPAALLFTSQRSHGVSPTAHIQTIGGRCARNP